MSTNSTKGDPSEFFDEDGEEVGGWSWTGLCLLRS